MLSQTFRPDAAYMLYGIAPTGSRECNRQTGSQIVMIEIGNRQRSVSKRLFHSRVRRSHTNNECHINRFDS